MEKYYIPEWCQKLLLEFDTGLNRIMEDDNLANNEKEMQINHLLLTLRDGIYDIREAFDLRPPSRAEIWSSVYRKYRDDRLYLKVDIPLWTERLLWAMKGVSVNEEEKSDVLWCL